LNRKRLSSHQLQNFSDEYLNSEELCAHEREQEVQFEEGHFARPLFLLEKIPNDHDRVDAFGDDSKNF
jgi:hypothetical protein